MHNFEKLLFWQKSIALAKNIYIICKEISSDEKFGLISQIKRCVVSIPSNIAEGSGRNSSKEFNHFLAIALGSAFELQTQLILVKELNLLTEDKVNALLNEVSEIQRMIYSFKNSLK
ncbi:four helix bundle protein [Chryseobacterium viscerum]|uniref:Four helix bundle protein n=1 Tax=Chryseobacterium viscerum TaxID=1037377 RepID=A0A316WMW3_9FLAO|nr:four helix bundle protein [Chryseobacterium viscerum]KAB1231209.1 four helix bundle protein [Chryseobacterium viscerum]PWN62675.1 four helix bundle protein [Chryseobacterium viscerum]